KYLIFSRVVFWFLGGDIFKQLWGVVGGGWGGPPPPPPAQKIKIQSLPNYFLFSYVKNWQNTSKIIDYQSSCSKKSTKILRVL
ncbi:MAG: hypothetical protein RML38_09625, partial [Bacteroidia bacterium]|nr:hypothetical protein [Bacteroidia bacterium]